MLDVVTREPLNAETPLSALDSPVTALDAFYVRGHYAIPHLDAGAWRLRVEGRVARPRSWSLDELRALPVVERRLVLECAGNGRSRMEPRPPGTPWGERAVSCGVFRGARLADVLAEARPDAGAVEALFVGADRDDERAYERSLSLSEAADALVAYELNGAPLTREHGAPVRLVVPGWYGMASVKWLTTVRLLDAPFAGHFQAHHYVYREGEPVRLMRVKSMLLSPRDGARLEAGRPVVLRGRAWSGAAPVARVDVSVDEGATWMDATIEAAREAGAYQAWELAWTPSRAGRVRILTRAHDASGQTQPLDPEWNALGYGFNTVVGTWVDVA